MSHKNAFARALASGLKAINQVAGITVTYMRGETKACMTAVPGKSDFESTDGNGQRTLFQTRDFIFLTGDIRLAGSKITPQKGDRIIEKTPDGKTLTHEVLPVTDGQEIHYCDTYRSGTRVHTKQIKAQ